MKNHFPRKGLALCVLIRGIAFFIVARRRNNDKYEEISCFSPSSSGFPRLVRFSWETTDKLMEKHCAKVEYYEDNDEQQPKQLPISAFFAKTTQPPRKKAFLSRGLNVVTQWTL